MRRTHNIPSLQPFIASVPEKANECQTLLLMSIDFASKAHFGQTRKSSNLPYVYHCFDVAKKALSYNEVFENTSYEEFGSACNLHDVLEDTSKTEEEIMNIFGKKVSDIVRELTMPKEIRGFKEKYSYLKGFKDKSMESIILKMADRICNVKDFLSNNETSWYACQYALQASPIFRAYMEKTQKANPKIILDISEMEQIIGRRYSVSLFTSTQEEIEQEIINF